LYFSRASAASSVVVASSASSNSASGQNKTEEHSKVKTEAYQMGHVWNVLKDPVLFHNEYGALDQQLSVNLCLLRLTKPV
jgi:hypothetical protein